MASRVMKDRLTTHVSHIVASQSVQEAWDTFTAALPEYGFTQQFYCGTSLPTQEGFGLIDETVVLINGPADYCETILAEKLYLHGVMFSWAAHNNGFLSYPDAMPSHGQAPTPKLLKLWELNASYGFVGGYVGGLNAIIPGMRAVIGLGGACHLSQDDLDASWEERGHEVELLCNTMHLRIASLPHTDLLRPLTSRQLEVLRWCAEGKMTQDIAIIMGISVGTVEKHMRMAREALEAQTTAHAVRKATSLNLLSA